MIVARTEKIDKTTHNTTQHNTTQSPRDSLAGPPPTIFEQRGLQTSTTLGRRWPPPPVENIVLRRVEEREWVAHLLLLLRGRRRGEGHTRHLIEPARQLRLRRAQPVPERFHLLPILLLLLLPLPLFSHVVFVIPPLRAHAQRASLVKCELSLFACRIRRPRDGMVLVTK